MTSTSDDFCGISRITSATLAAVTTFRVDKVDELIRVMGECTKQDDLQLQRDSSPVA